MGKKYPSLGPGPPPGFVRPSLVERILKPGVVLVTVVVLLMCSVVGAGVGIATFKKDRVEPMSASMGACHGFILVAVS